MSLQVTLQDLVSPLTATSFQEQHLIPGRPYLSSPSQALVDKVLSIPDLQDFDAFVRRLETVGLLGANGFRSTVPGRVAMDFYNRGDTLYLHSLERTLPASIFGAVAADLGVHPRYIGLEMFAGRARAISTLHYDHDTNFQILLRGKKTWRIAPNRHIAHPLASHHDLHNPRDESLSEALPLPTRVEELDGLEEWHPTAGTSLFLPMGYWHEVIAFEDSIALNVVIKPQRWSDAIATAAQYAAITMPELRAPAFGALSDDSSPLKQHARQMLRAGIATFERALTQLDADDIGLAADTTALRWSTRTASRRLEDAPPSLKLVCPDLTEEALDVEDDIAPLMRQLVRLKGVFGLEDLKRLAPGVPSRRLLQVILTMTHRQYFQGA